MASEEAKAGTANGHEEDELVPTGKERSEEQEQLTPEEAEALLEAEAMAEEGAIAEGDELAALIAERDELKERLLRALADVENLRKRAERERREAAQYGGAKLAKDLLTVYDNLQRALAAVDEEQRKVAGALIEGIELTLRELLAAFERHDIRPISPKPGDRFDPHVHQAMFEAPVPGTEAGSIIQVMTEGFTIGERLLRPAQVGVSSNHGGTAPVEEAEAASEAGGQS